MFVEGPKPLGAEFKSSGNVEGVEGADTERGAVTAGEVDGSLPCGCGKFHFDPQALFAIALKDFPGQLRNFKSQALEKYLLIKGAAEFSAIGRRKENCRRIAQSLVSLRRMGIDHVAGDQKA